MSIAGPEDLLADPCPVRMTGLSGSFPTAEKTAQLLLYAGFQIDILLEQIPHKQG